MIAIAAALLLSASAMQPPPVPGGAATVRICSLAVSRDSCADLSAALIDPTLHPSAGGQGIVAFVDPASGNLVEPTVEELRGLSRLRAYEKQGTAREEAIVETLPDGTRRARLGASFMVDLGVETAAPAPATTAATEEPR